MTVFMIKENNKFAINTLLLYIYKRKFVKIYKYFIKNHSYFVLSASNGSPLLLIAVSTY